jgi:hypothetical protein
MSFDLALIKSIFFWIPKFTFFFLQPTCLISLIIHLCTWNFYTGSPFWKLVLKQFDDLLVKILIAAAVVSFFLARMNGETGLSAFLEPSVS